MWNKALKTASVGGLFLHRQPKVLQRQKPVLRLSHAILKGAQRYWNEPDS
jgi:hypothetical protein